jgi:hypothetical protein
MKPNSRVSELIEVEHRGGVGLRRRADGWRFAWPIIASGERAKPLVAIYQQYEYEAEVKAAFEKWCDHVAALVGGNETKKAAA